jgi:hypothetical protein
MPDYRFHALLLSRDAISLLVGAGGFEPPTSCSQSRRANQAALRPVLGRIAPVVDAARRNFGRG